MSPPVIGILVCDHVSSELRDAAGGRDYPDMYAEMLTTADPTVGVRIYDVVGGELPDSVDACDGWIITGSRHDAFADDDWLLRLNDFVREIRDRRARLVGVCFGHQVVANALGGEVGRSGGWKAGPQGLTVEPTDWFAGGEVAVHAMHQDAVSTLPPGGRTIGAGTTADHPIYLVDESILCIQDHPEFDDRYIRSLIEARRSRMGDDVAAAALAQIDVLETHPGVIGRWLVDFALDRKLGEHAPRRPPLR